MSTTGATAYNPMQPVYAPTAYSGASVDPSTTLNMILQGFTPQAQSSQVALNNQLAAMGIQGGGATDATTALQRNLAAGIAPTLGSAVQSAQGMTLQQALANQQAQNQMNMFNAGQYGASGTTLAQMLQSAYGQQLGAYTGLLGQGQSTAGNLAGQEAQNFAVYQPNPIWGVLGSAAGAYTGGLGARSAPGAMRQQPSYQMPSYQVPSNVVSGGGGGGYSGGTGSYDYGGGFA